MQKNYTNIYGTQIHDTQGNLLGMLLDCVFEKETGQILAYQILARGGVKRYILPVDIRVWIGNKIIITGEDAIEDLENLYRVQEGITLPKTPVLNPQNEKLGRVTDYWIEHKTGLLTQIEVAQRFLFFFQRNVRIFPRKKIRKMDGEEITVEDDGRDLALDLAKARN